MKRATQFLGKMITVYVDRPLGSQDPKYGSIRLLNYGHIKDTKAPDGEYVDAYILGVFEPLKQFRGKCIAVIHRLTEEDDKLVVVPKGVFYSDEQIKALTEFHERFYKSIIIRKRN